MNLTSEHLIADENSEAIYHLLADIEPDDWEDAETYGVSPRPAGEEIR